MGEKLDWEGAGGRDGGVGIRMVLEQLQGTKMLRRGEIWLREANCLPPPLFQGKTECSFNLLSSCKLTGIQKPQYPDQGSPKSWKGGYGGDKLGVANTYPK